MDVHQLESNMDSEVTRPLFLPRLAPHLFVKRNRTDNRVHLKMSTSPAAPSQPMPTQVGVPQGFNSPDLLASQHRAMLACFLVDTEMIVKLNNKYPQHAVDYITRIRQSNRPKALATLLALYRGGAEDTYLSLISRLEPEAADDLLLGLSVYSDKGELLQPEQASWSRWTWERLYASSSKIIGQASKYIDASSITRIAHPCR